MTGTCRQIQDTLATEGVRALRSDEEVQQHVAECSDCFAVLESLNALDETFDALPKIDAPDAAVERLLARRSGGAVSTPVLSGRPFLSGWRSGLRWSLPLAGAGAAVVVVLLLPLTRPEVPGLAELEMARVEPGQSMLSTEQVAELDQVKEQRRAGNRPIDGNEAPARFGDLTELQADPPAGQTVTGFYEDSRVDGLASRPSQTENVAGEEQSSGAPQLEAGGGLASNLERDERANQNKDETDDFGDGNDDADDADDAFRANNTLARGRDAVDRKIVGGVVETTVPSAGPSNVQPVRVGGDSGIEPPDRVEYVAPVFPDVAQNARAQGVVLLEVQIAADGEVIGVRILRSIPLLDDAAVEAVEQWGYAPPIVGGVAVPVVMTVPVSFTIQDTPDVQSSPGMSPDGGAIAARSFVEDRARTERLSFQPARGYWANTYVPGDPVLRGLRAVLAPDSSAHVDGPVELHDASHRVRQPFDRPSDSAVAVYIASDHSATDGPRRALVQVGLQAAPRHAGHRVAMRLAIVVDLPGPVTPALVEPVRELLESFAAARGPADRFSLVVAGHDLRLSADEFRYGAINVGLRDILEAGPRGADNPDLESAMRFAVRTVTAENTSASIPGAGAVVLVTSQPFGASTVAVERLAMRSAAAGIPVSVVGVGDGYDADAIDRIVLAGQGNRRVMRSAGDAAALVDRELSASSRVVARALRLRIRLAPGVKLVEVIGSERLGTSKVERVRETERQLDRELARSLGIESDRGKDEDGIQIVIPSFHAGDSHTVLLDVVAPGPGVLADVTVRYKDLVFLRNGVARATTSLHRGDDVVGPLQANVLKNFLAHRLSETLERSARLLSRSQPAEALRTLVEARQFLVGLRAELRWLVTDPDLNADLTMLQEYVSLLDTDATEADRVYWSRSMRYAGLLKILPRPVT